MSKTSLLQWIRSFRSATAGWRPALIFGLHLWAPCPGSGLRVAGARAARAAAGVAAVHVGAGNADRGIRRHYRDGSLCFENRQVDVVGTALSVLAQRGLQIRGGKAASL